MADNLIGLLLEISADPSKAEAALARLKASTVGGASDISSLWSQVVNATTDPTGVALPSAKVIGGFDSFEQAGRSVEQSIAPFTNLAAQFKQLAATLPQVTTPLDKLPTQLSTIVGALGTANPALVEFEETAKTGLATFADAIGRAGAAALVEGQNIGRAIDQATKEVLKQVASQSLAKALYETGCGFADLAIGDFADAALHFEAAAIFGSLGAIAGTAGAAIPGGGAGAPRGAGAAGQAGRFGYGGARGGGGYTPQGEFAPGSQAAPPGGNLTVMVLGEDAAAQWLSDNVLNPYVQRGGTLYASQATRASYSGG